MMRFNTTVGMQAPPADHSRPITESRPIAVSEYKQLMLNTTNNLIPDEFGVTNGETRYPMQQIIPTSGGKYSGRTGPIS